MMDCLTTRLTRTLSMTPSVSVVNWPGLTVFLIYRSSAPNVDVSSSSLNSWNNQRESDWKGVVENPCDRQLCYCESQCKDQCDLKSSTFARITYWCDWSFCYCQWLRRKCRILQVSRWHQRLIFTLKRPIFTSACNIQYLIAHVRYIKILTRLRGFWVKITNFSRFHCLVIPKRAWAHPTNQI